MLSPLKSGGIYHLGTEAVLCYADFRAQALGNSSCHLKSRCHALSSEAIKWRGPQGEEPHPFPTTVLAEQPADSQHQLSSHVNEFSWNWVFHFRQVAHFGLAIHFVGPSATENSVLKLGEKLFFPFIYGPLVNPLWIFIVVVVVCYLISCALWYRDRCQASADPQRYLGTLQE